MAKIKNYILGLDVGVNSVGWTVVECAVEEKKQSKENNKVSKTYMPIRVVDLNSRIFQEMVDEKDTPKNQKRRTMRGMRRRASRLKGRREALIDYLQKHKLLPKELNEQFFNEVAHSFAKRVASSPSIKKMNLPTAYLISPMLMRAYALDDKLEPYEFSCALLQLQKRRGYKSNRGAKYDALYEHILEEEGRSPVKEEKLEDDDENEKEEEERKVLGGIAALKKEIKERQLRTIAEYVLQRAIKDKQPLKRITGYKVMGEKEDEVSLYAERALYKEEFEKIWQAQASHLGLTNKDKDKIKDIIFCQRPLMNPPPQSKRWSHLKYNDVGVCSFFPRRQRAAKALLESQDYRTWQAISNIRIKDDKDSLLDEKKKKTDDGLRLSMEQKQKIAEHLKNPDNLNKRGRLSWEKVGKLIGGKINYQSGSDDDKKNANAGICGNRTEIAIIEVIGDKWSGYDKKTQRKLVNCILFKSNKVDLYKELTKEWGFSKGAKGEALGLATLELEPRYMKHCRDVISKVLKRMQTQGEDYYKACEKLNYHSFAEQTEQGELTPANIPTIANPRVQKGLYEIRKVVNAIIAKYGRPSVIRLELARDLKASKEHRDDIKKRQAKNRKLNEEADREMSELMASEKKFNRLTTTRQGIFYLSATERKKYRMWKEQKHQCLYCGGPISKNDLLDSAETEHIIPQSSFHQNYMNTVLACRTCNQDKGDRTPYQAWGATDKWGQIESRLKTTGEGWKQKCIKYPELPFPKIKRILSKGSPEENEEGFVEGQLSDTRYIATTAKNILAKLGIRIGITKGGATALLRDLWGLDGVLPHNPDEAISYDRIDEKTGEIKEKNRSVTIGEFENIKKNLKKGEIIKTSYNAEESSKVKNRMDHRHHAIDAFIASMTDHSTLIQLTRLNRLMRAKRFLEYKEKKDKEDKEKITELEAAIKNIKSKIRRPDKWQSSNPMAKDIRDILVMNKVVSHQKKTKIWGALHEETVYGEASYITKFELNTRSPTLRELKKYLPNNEGSEEENRQETWILRQAERDVIQAWVEEQEPLAIKERSLPMLNGRMLPSIFLAHRCYVINKPLNKDILKLAEKEEWKEGTGSWIKDRGTHYQLHQWLKAHKNPEQALKEDPPRMKSANGEGNVIKSVRIARIFGNNVITHIDKSRIYFLGSNHHIEIFINDKKEQRGRVVSMKEAAERKSQKRLVVNKDPSPEWGDGWKFFMSLAINDMVWWSESDERLQSIKELGAPIFRVQLISDSAIFFRHHSTALTIAKERHGLIQAKATTINCQKISVDTLGDYERPS